MNMVINAKKLEIALIKKEMDFVDLMKKTNLSGTSVSRLRKGEDVRMKTVSRVVKALNIDVEDII